MRAFPFLVPSILLAGCAAGDAGRYPSLLPRAIEQRGEAEPAQPEPAAVVADPALDTRLAEQRSLLARQTAQFASLERRAAPLARVAQRQAVGSEAWIAAQAALAELDGARADTSALVADLEAMAIERGTSGAADYPAIGTLHDEAAAQLARETGRISQLQGMLRS